MEEITRTYPNGKRVNYRMTREAGFFTSHIWVYKDGKPYLHIMPTKQGTGQVFKNCDGYGYMSMCEIVRKFENIKLNDIIGL